MEMQQGLATSKLMKLAMLLQLSLRELEVAPMSLMYSTWERWPAVFVIEN